jgi:hypothetical protein
MGTGEVTVLVTVLFSDCYEILVVMTKPKEKEGVTKYHVNRRVCLLFPLPYMSA